MASTYSSNLKIELMTTGEKATTWGSITNTNLGTTLEEAIVGTADVTFASADLSITLTNSNATQAARNIRLNLTGTTGGTARTLTVPDIEKTYIVNNGCADAVAISNSTGSTVSVPAGKSMWVYSTGSNVVDVTTHLTSLTVGATPSSVVTESATQTLTNKTLTTAELGSSTATTQSASDDSTKVATTAFVQDALGQTDIIGSAQLSADSVGSSEIAANAVGASELNVSGNGTTSQFLRSDGDGTFTWATPTDTNTTYSAGSGLDLSGTTFSVETDLRDGITHVGLDSGDYIGFTNNSRIDFYVNGGNEARLESDGDFHADGDVIAYSTTISDARLKQNVQGIENAVAKVGQLNGYTFEYIADGKISAGVIAQEVEAVLPEAVSEKLLPLKKDDGQEYKVVNYDALHGLLIEAVKELTARVEELEAK
jgi:hypothetical protein